VVKRGNGKESTNITIWKREIGDFTGKMDGLEERGGGLWFLRRGSRLSDGFEVKGSNSRVDGQGGGRGLGFRRFIERNCLPLCP
jgi:hypothetical protein